MEELVFNPRKMSVAMVGAELDKHPDLTIDQLRALLEHEGSQYRPRGGVEDLFDARLTALAEAALELVAEDMEDVRTDEAGDPITQGDTKAPEQEAPVEDDGPFGVEGPESVSDVQEAEPEEPEDEDPGFEILPEDDESSDDQDIPTGTQVHVTMENSVVHEGYYVRPQSGAMIRMRDGQDTIVYVADHNFVVSPVDDDSEDDSEDDGGD